MTGRGDGRAAPAGLYCMENYRTAQQLAEMQRLEADGLCLFCPEVLSGHDQLPALFRNEHWTVMPNEFPYPGTRLHLLVVPHRHVPDVLDLDAEALAGFWAAMAWARQHYDLTYYGLGMRNGDCRHTGATIAHVHAHLLVSDTGAEPFEPVRMRFSRRPSS